MATVNGRSESELARGTTKVVTVVPTCDTSAYAVGDLLFDATEIANAASGVVLRIGLKY